MLLNLFHLFLSTYSIMTSRKLKIRYMVHITFLLDSAGSNGSQEPGKSLQSKEGLSQKACQTIVGTGPPPQIAGIMPDFSNLSEMAFATMKNHLRSQEALIFPPFISLRVTCTKECWKAIS